MHITDQTCYDIKYITMRLSGYMNATTETALIALKNGMEYIMQHPNEPIMYPRKKMYKTYERPHQCYLKVGDA